MRDALTHLLYNRYPVLCAEHRLDASESGMAWGFQHDDGWFVIVEALASVVTAHVPGGTAAYVKQRMGALRFSLNEGDAFTRSACAAAERFSLTISEVSGRRGVLMVGRQGRWLRTLALGEFAGFVPVPRKAPGACEGSLAGGVLYAAPTPSAPQPHAEGAQAFHQAMASPLHPITGECGPVDDRGIIANGTEGR